MNKEWSDLHKTAQLQIKKKDSFSQGIDTLISLRKLLLAQLIQFRKELSDDEICAIPFLNAEGYHSKTIAYSIWHIFRIEDIVAHSIVAGDEQVFFACDYQKRINSPIITTGNELFKEQIADFSRQLNLDELYNYIVDVDRSTTQILNSLSFDEMKKKITAEKKRNLLSLKVVSEDEKAIWLVDYWCGKDVRGLVGMPFSRHWIMHIEACLRIVNKLKK